MPVKRRVQKSRAHRITPEAVAAFTAGDHCALHRALGLKPWEASPVDPNIEHLEAPMGGQAWRESWPRAQALRKELEKACGKRGARSS